MSTPFLQPPSELVEAREIISRIEGENFTTEEIEHAEEMSLEIQNALDGIVSGHNAFVTSFAKLGTLLFEVRSKKYWKIWGYETFGAYIKVIEEKVSRGRSQIYSSISVAERLLPYASTEQIEKMGISKATELGKLVKTSGKGPSEDLIDLAVDPEIGTDEFKAEAYTEYHVQKSDEDRSYYDLKGFYATDEEKEEIERAYDIAARTDPVIPQETSDWGRRKEIILRLCREYLSTYENAVLRGEG